MAIIWTKLKNEEPLKTEVKETVMEVWTKVNGNYDTNRIFNKFNNPDLVLLTEPNGKPFIWNKRYFLWKITE